MTGNGSPGLLEGTGNEGLGPGKIGGGLDQERAQEMATEIQDLQSRRTLKLVIFLTEKFKTLLDLVVLLVWRVFGGK